MYKLLCPGNVLYLELVGKAASSGDMNNSGKSKTCGNALYKDNSDYVNISAPLRSHLCQSSGSLSLYRTQNVSIMKPLMLQHSFSARGRYLISEL